MSKTVAAPLICQIYKKPKPPNSGMIAELIRPSLLEFIKKKLPDLDTKGFICLAAIQAPIIMMSQNRSEARDRLRAENDYKVNLKAELEIRHLHEKIDHLLRRQYNRLFEIQQIQIELLEEISRQKK